MTEKEIKRDRRERLPSILFMGVILAGALGVGVCLMLSEILYPEIEEFAGCPFWYRMTMYLSLFTVVCGIIGCGFTKNKSNTAPVELFVELGLCVVGIIGLGFAFARNEAYWKDVMICVGGSLCAVGFFCGIGTAIGLTRKSKGEYAFYLGSFTRKKAFPYGKPIPAGISQMMEVEKYFNAMLPPELTNFLLTCNGDGELLFSAEDIAYTTKMVRESFDGVYPGIEKLCFFGGNGCGDYFCYPILSDGTIAQGEIFLWKHETNERIFVANTLPELIDLYYSDQIPV